jgi:hypothetical protein
MRLAAIAEAELMPPLRHSYDGYVWREGMPHDFDMRKSEMITWLMSQPNCRAWATHKLLSSLKHSSTIVPIEGSERKLWVGCGRGNSQLEGCVMYPGRLDARRVAVVALAEEMKPMTLEEAGAWLLSTDAGYGLAATRLKQALVNYRHPVISCVGGKGGMWQGNGVGAYRNRVRSNRREGRKRGAEKLRIFYAERKAGRPTPTQEELAALYEKRRIEAQARGRVNGFKPHANEAGIKQAMVDAAIPAEATGPGTPRHMLFKAALARFTVSPASLDRYRRELITEGRLVQCVRGLYKQAMKSPQSTEPVEEVVYL